MRGEHGHRAEHVVDQTRRALGGGGNRTWPGDGHTLDLAMLCRAEHDEIPNRSGSHESMRANIVEAVRTRIHVMVGLIRIRETQRGGQAGAEMIAVRVDHRFGEVTGTDGSAGRGAVGCVTASRTLSSSLIGASRSPAGSHRIPPGILAAWTQTL
ncbi:hypothetical protein ADL00_40530 [Streptomyces sp. AS58]|uniref:hypothetical protein n=1 Tax=Streptomyces sp. AS58 TaxID=1519489 RepID=UPI0006AF22C0|nr:hypothetical protein [Streptomyces sp. AS58]KOV51434.1 hypothetical protein ADL00_40530 [Streptomyces sp. AS58]